MRGCALWVLWPMGCLWARDLPTDLPMLTELCACALVCASAAQIGRGRQYFAHAPKRTISQFRVEGCNLHLDVPPPPRDLHVVEERGAGQRPTWRVQWVAPRLSEDGEEIAEYCVELCHEDLLGRDTGRRGGGLASHDDSGGLGGAAGEHVQGGGARLRVDASGAISGTTTSKGGGAALGTQAMVRPEGKPVARPVATQPVSPALAKCGLAVRPCATSMSTACACRQARPSSCA